MFDLTPSDLAFLDARELSASVTTSLPAPPSTVFAAIADQSTWRHWCADLIEASWSSSSLRSQVSAVRTARFRFATFDERILAWDPPHRFAFSVDRCSIPIARRAAEDWRLRELGGGGSTELTWTLAVDVAPLARPAWPAARLAVAAVFKKTAAGLARYVTTTTR